MPEINYWAVLVSGAVAMVLGGLWYGPLFGKIWMKGQGWDPGNKEQMEKVKQSAGPAYAQMFVLSLVQAFVFAHVLWAFNGALSEKMSPLVAGLQGGLWMWLGFIVPIKYGDKLWNGKQFKYVAIDLGYYLVLLMVIGVILASWK
jgi:hypothetical protein